MLPLKKSRSLFERDKEKCGGWSPHKVYHVVNTLCG